ncbi:hypothetical protein Tco_0365419 [Tanacetum coccineum]
MSAEEEKEEYDIWAMEIEHYLEYIDNEVWQQMIKHHKVNEGVIQNAVEKERKAKNILLMAIPKEHMRRFHGMVIAKESWVPYRTRVFEQEIQGAPKPSSSAQNIAFVSQSKSSNNKVKSGFSGAYSSCTPSTSSTNVPEKEVLAGFADEVIYSLFAKQTEDLDLLHEDLEQ